MQVVDLFNLRCSVCGFPLKYEFNKNYGLNLWICTNEAELCDFMANDRTHMHDILKCPKCTDGYLIVKRIRRMVTYSMAAPTILTKKESAPIWRR